MQKSTIDFLRKLKKNNHREWFDANKSAYQQALADFTSFVDELIGRIAEFDPSVKHIEPKDCLFRIYNDVRFAKDKSPYKNHFGAFISKDGRKSAGPGYYIHIEPGKAFGGAGVYMAEAPVMQRIRESIATDPEELRGIITTKDFKKQFGELWREGALKTAPKGFPKDHPAIDLLQLKHFIGDHAFSDEDILDAKFAQKAANVYKAALPLNNWLRQFLG